MALVFAVLHAHERDVFAVEEFGVALMSRVAYALLEQESACVWLQAQQAAEALVGCELFVVLKHQGNLYSG